MGPNPGLMYIATNIMTVETISIVSIFNYARHSKTLTLTQKVRKTKVSMVG